MIAHSPLHGSGRAGVSHPAPASGDDAKTARRRGMTHACGKQPLVGEPTHPGPEDTAILATARQGAVPEPADLEPEEEQREAVHGHAVISDMPCNDRPQPRALLRDGIVHASSEFGFDLAQLGLQPFADGLSQHREAPVAPSLRADVREAKTIERLGLALAAPASVVGRGGSELDEAGFVGMQFEFELEEALLEFALDRLASISLWKPSTMSSANLTTMTSPWARFFAEPTTVSRYRRCWFRLPRLLTESALRSDPLSRLNTRPARTPVNASATPSRAIPHDSGPVRVATRSPCDSFIHNFAGLTGAQEKTHG
jgi:hypothetical protein